MATVTSPVAQHDTLPDQPQLYTGNEISLQGGLHRRKGSETVE